MSGDSTSSISFGAINQSVGAIVSNREGKLKETLSGLGENISTGDMLMMQQEVQQWTMFTQIQSTIVKEVSDAIKAVIQKAA